MDSNKQSYNFAASYSAAISSSLTSLTGGITYEDPKFHLHLLQKTEPPSDRPIIHSTKLQRLAFYRSFSSSTDKTDIVQTQVINLNRFVWFYALNTFFKSLPHAFVHIFLAAYAPEEHMFVTKMVPISYGLKYLFTVTGLLEIITTMDTVMFLAYYGFLGIADKNPWNRCPKRVYFDETLNVTMHCYELSEFAKKFINRSNSILHYNFISEDKEIFQLSQIDFYRLHRNRIVHEWGLLAYLLIFWCACQICTYQVTKGVYWKILYRCHWILNIIDIVMLIYLLSVANNSDTSIPIAQIPRPTQEEENNLWSADLGMFAESITAPSIVHVLTARSTQKINPTADSALMILSNALIYLFRGILTHVLKEHCERLVNTEIPVTQFNQKTWFYLYPIFFSNFYLGDIFMSVYLSLNLIIEYFVAIITYRCLLESVVYEWPKIKRWMALSAMTIIGIIMFIYTNVNNRIVLWIYYKSLSTLLETLCIYILYPIGRLVDDYTFHCGQNLTKLRILSFRLVPVYYLVKLYLTLRALWYILETTGVGKETWHYTWSWSVPSSVFILGAMFIVYKYIVVYKMTWTHIFRPLPKWGPRDFSVRQLRKQFDSRFYVGSQVPRLLSRYLMAKRDSKVYKIDVRYDVGMGRRSTLGGSVRFGENKDKKS